MQKTKERNISLDFLRIIAMFMVVMLHVLGKGEGLDSTVLGNKVAAWILEAFCIGCVNIYVLISGYFLVDSKFSWKKVFKLWGQVIFYSWLFLILYYLIGGTISKKNLLFSIFPILTRTNYWFVTTYIFMYIVSPFLNILIEHLSKKQHFNLCLILFIIFSVISFVLPNESLLDNTCGTGIIWFITLYLIAAYFKKYPKKYKNTLLIYVLSSISIVSFTFLTEYILKLLGISISQIWRFYTYNSLFTTLASISIFLFFCNKNINNKILTHFTTLFAPITFGVYLIHENIFVRQKLYQGALRLINYQECTILLFVLAAFMIATIVFFSSATIEFIRNRFFKCIGKTKICLWLQKKFDSILCKVEKIVNWVYENIV